MFGPMVIPQLPRTLCRRLERSMKYVWIALGVTIASMIMAGVWQWLFDVRDAKNLFDGVPAAFKWLTFAGLISFAISLFITLFALPLQYDIEVRWKAWKKQR